MKAILVFMLPLLCAAQWDPQTTDNKQSVVHLFEWTWDAIAQECEDFLGPQGYGAIQISPPTENKVNTDENRPWHERYQPVSYYFTTRSGDEAALKSMIDRCNNAGVRIYADIIINHMAAGTEGTTGGSTYDAANKDYPAVPYSFLDFNGDCTIDYGDAILVRNCPLLGMPDLNQGTDYVRTKIVETLNILIGMGMAGFRVDAAKHMWPGDLATIYDSLSDLNIVYFDAGSRPFIYQEVIDQGGEAISSSEYTGIARVTEFKFSVNIGSVFHGSTELQYLVNFGEGWSFMDGVNAVAFIDNHDNQRGDGGGGDVVTYKEPRLYKMATAFMLAWPYGFTRVMSSFAFETQEQGPPQDGSGNIIPPTFEEDGSWDNSLWICEHRWRQIYNMVKFRTVVDGTVVSNWWDNGGSGGNQIAFARAGMGFVAINSDTYDLSGSFQTTLPAGTYCELASGELSDDGTSCSGDEIIVDSSGFASIYVSTTAEDGFVAIHIDQMKTEESCV